MILYKNDLTIINYYLALPIILMAAEYGAIFPDIDHSWHNVRDKTVPKWIINKLIHLTGGRHRSWQTHSIDIVMILTILVSKLTDLFVKYGRMSVVNKEVFGIISAGFFAGWISHLLSDMLTSAGVRVICFLDYKVALTPKKIGRLRFNTGNEWERFNYKVIRLVNIALGVIALTYPILSSRKFMVFVENIRNL